MRNYLTLRKAAFLGALVSCSLLTGYEAGAMKSANQAYHPSLASAAAYDIASDAQIVSDASGVSVNGTAPHASISKQPVAQPKPIVNTVSRVYATKRLTSKHAHHVHKLSGQQDYDFGYVFGGSDLD